MSLFKGVATVACPSESGYEKSVYPVFFCVLQGLVLVFMCLVMELLIVSLIIIATLRGEKKKPQ